MEIYDAHVHIGRSTQWLPYMNPEVDAEQIIDSMERHGIKKAVIFPNPHIGNMYPALNDDVADAVKNFPERFIGFGRVDPRRGEESVKEIERFQGLGLKGLKLHPIVECFRPDHPFFEKLFAKANELKLPVAIHSGTFFGSPSYVKKVLKGYKELRIILCHLSEGSVPIIEEYENAYADTSASRSYLVEYAVDRAGEKLLFGSDYPYLKVPVEIEVVKACEIPESAKRKIFSENFKKFFGL